MKCKNSVDGKVCGEDVPPSSKFCGFCGGKVVTEDDNTTKACPKCSFLITNRQKFCSGCAWKIDPSIFLQKKIFCQGLTPENKICGVELSPDVKFCCECGTVQSNPAGETQQKVSEPVRELKVDEFMKDELPRRQPHESSGSGSSSRSESPDTWRAPGIPILTPDSSSEDNEIHASGGRHLPVRSIGENTSQENEETADSRYLQEKGREMRDSSTISNEDNVENSGDLETEAILSSATDTVNNNVTEPTPSQEPMETEPNIQGGNSWTWNTENSQTISYENRSSLTLAVTESDVIKPHSFTLPSSNTAPLDGVPSEPERKTNETEQIEESSGNPPEEIQAHDMGTGSKQPSQGKSKVLELTKKFESTVTIESSGNNQEPNKGSPELKREFSHSSAGSEVGSDVDSVPSEEEDEEDDKDDQVSEEAENKTGKKKTKLSKAEKNRLKKKQRKERNKRRKLNLPEEEPIVAPKESPKTVKTPKDTQSASTKEDKKPVQTEQPVTSENLNDKKTEEMEKHYQTRSVTHGKNAQEDKQTNEDKSLVSENQLDRKTDKEDKNNSTKAQQKEDKKDDKKTNQKPSGSGESSSSNKSSGENKTTTKATGGKKYAFSEAYFHIIVSPSLLKDSNSGDVFVHFQSPTLGGWNCKKHKFVFKRKLPEEFMEYQILVKIPKELLQKPLYYSYYVIPKGYEKIDEYVYNYASETNYRTLFLAANKSKDIIHQYDGVIKEKPEKDRNKGLFKTIKGWIKGDDFKKHLKMEAAFSFQHFLPRVQLSTGDTAGIAGEEIILHVENIYEGLKTTYHISAGLWNYGTEFHAYLHKEVHEYISAVVTKIHEKRKGKVEMEDQVLLLAGAITMVYLKETYSIELREVDQDRLCKALLPFVDKERKQCPEYDGLVLFFPRIKKRMSDALLKMIKTMAKDSTKSGLFYCIPLHHFLLGKYVPYQSATAKVNHDDAIPEWWGIADFSIELSYFQGKSKWDRNKTEILEAIVPYFAVDFLLPRTFIASLRLQHFDEIDLELIPTDAILAGACYFIKTRTATFVTENAKSLKRIFGNVSSQLVKIAEDSKFMLETPLRNYKIAGDVLNNLYSTWGDEKSLLCLAAVEILSIAVDWFAKCLALRESQGDKGTYTNHLTCYQLHRDKVKSTLINEQYYGHEVFFLKLWNKALTLKIPEGKIRDNFLNFMKDNLESCLDRRSVGTEVKLIEIYCENIELFGDSMQEILSKLAYKAVEKGSSLYFGTSIRGAALMRFGVLLSQVFERSMDLHQLSDQHKILDYTLNWAPFSTHVKIFYHEEYSKSLSSTSSALMSSFVEVIKQASEALAHGQILVQDLQTILGKVDHFKSVVAEIKDNPIRPDYLIATLALREKELHGYQTTLKIVQDFVYMCTRFTGNTKKLEDKIKCFEKLENVSLNLLCKVAMLNETKHPEEYQPTVIAFDLEDHVVQTIPYILKCGQGLLFTTLWDRRGNELAKQKGKSLDLDEILTEVWEPTYKFWDDLCTRLKNGDLKFSEFEKYFKTTDMETLRNELMKLSQDGNTKWIDIRLDQLEKYRNLQSCLFGARAIMEVVKEFELTGNFNQILEILKLTGDADTKMNTLDDNMMKTCKILTGIDEEKAKSLRTFIACKPLVVWLRETMPSGLKELKVFVDLASISAGEGDYEIDKVNCLHSATTGYSPLIFSLNQDCDAAVFLHRCEEVWKELKADSKLPKKLVDTQRQLDWLKSVKQTHGSVEVTSLAQAEAINTNGIYQVGNLKKTATIKNPTLGEVLELRVTEAEGQRLQRNQYKYEQLHDLQSRLMLVAGKAEKGKDDVDRFMLILDSVVRLGNIYTKLVAEGCVLFSQWHVKFLCDRTRKACAFINFGFGEDKHTLKGRIDDTNEDVSSIIPKLAKFLEQCHKKWLDYIDERREKYYLLNFFTVDQMVILQQELVKLGTEVEPSVLIFPMLSAVKHGCTKEDLVRAMSSAKDDVDKLDSQREEQMEEETQAEAMDAENEADDVKIAKFLEVMTKSYPIELVREALKHVSPDDIDEGLVWCMDNEETFIPEEQGRQSPVLTEPIEKEINYTGWTQSGQSLASITASLVSQLDVESKENSVDKLVKALEDLWNTFLNSISSSVSDYLSVEHLGLILNRLAEQEQLIVDRTFLPSFKAGEPNLIICPQSEIYNTVLSVYSHEDDRPLPQSDEVLLCTPQTTLDMIEIFWRRSLFANNSKVHCLVNADLLDYDVSDRGERTLERLMKNAESKGMKYRLVVICSSENEYKSRVVAALDKYHRPQLPIDVPNVRKYLLTKLKVERSTTGVRPASAVDFERCSVRVVKSWRAGVGKTLYKKRMVADLYKLVPNIPRRMSSNVTIPLHEKAINTNDIMDIFLQETLPPRCHEPRIFHIDISHEVQEGVDAFLFQLLILGCLGHSSGHVWRRLDVDYYIIESMPLLARSTDAKLKCLHHCLDILPHVMCRSPQESLEILTDVRRPPDYTDHDRLFDGIEFKSPTFQRPYQYLKRLDTNCRLDDVNANIPEEDKKQCLNTLLRHCGIREPSWSELHHFVSFLNKQLQDFEVSAFCGLAAVEDLPGFAKFVLRFLIQMSRDFSTRSLKVSEESPIQMLQRQISDEEEENKEDDNVIQLYQMRRTWETSPHPYLFFNPDHHSMTFLGFNIDRRTGNLIDLQTRNVLEEGIMQQNLFDALVRNRVNLAENFDSLPRHEKILKLCNVMGLDMAHDPDDTYELTTDNVKKILAIYMRFRCDIPVIIMGETGCGKTRLIKFMCSLQQPPGATVDNMILMKVHGGTKVSDIKRKVRKAEEMARKNAADYPFMDTVLFFDEANTTEAIGVIKEIMCDRSLEGKPIKLHEKLKIVAACNPYRKHSDELIKRLEQAGLGYHVDADKTTDKLGRVPMRRLVYRVQPLPQSMLPLVWDFGQLNTEVEEMYIRQMVLRYTKNQKLPAIQGLEDVVSKILTVSQDFMRNQKDECSFVSLRDVERVLEVMSWFHRQSEDDNSLFQKMNQDSDYSDAESEDETMEVEQPQQQMDEVTRSLVLALGVCYHACLKNRREYRETVAPYFRPPLQLPGGAEQVEEEITKCQKVFLDSVELAENIARNQALKENVFMMVVCIELRIPMFLVGKPGSSKSLAKTIVADAMQGNAAHKALFKNYKQVQMISYQCSPISVPEGIVGTFRQCAAYQKDKNLDRFVSVVVLDEIGLAEDSPKMPLKTLHPLLEDGCPDDEDPEPYKKVAFIGISNWALDPAKMNRGILVQREVPDITELRESAEGICSTDREVLKFIKPMIVPMADSYLELFEEASTEMREFFGLRDFYSLLKMLYAFVSKSRNKPSWQQLKHSILRNFGGLEKSDPVNIFYSKLSGLVNKHEEPNEDDPDCTSAGMIQACLSGAKSSSESRYLLLLTENYGALTILQQKISMHNAVVIFGSSFPSDQEYTQVCRNINRIKVCMETGSTVILLNLENLYESLYDALNQYYVQFGGERYVDLGLGTHRVKCRVHRNFRLIVVAEKQIVYDKFPIPLINRLEKHFLSLKTMLTPCQLDLTEKLQEWAQNFCEAKVPAYMRKKKDIRKIGDAFMGYHADTCAAIILHVCQEKRCNDEAVSQIEKEILRDAQSILLWCATPAAVWQLDDKRVFNTYFSEQHHDSLANYLHYKMVTVNKGSIYAQITTNSKLMSTADIEILCRFIPIQKQNVTLLTLQSFDTEQQFNRKIKACFDQTNPSDLLLIVQCDCGDQNADLIACARYTVQGELQQIPEEISTDVHVVFLIQLPGIAGGCFSGFQCGLWHSVHIDDLHPAPEEIPSVSEMHGKSVSALLATTKERPSEVKMDVMEGDQMERMETNEEEVDLMDIELQEKTPDIIFTPKRQFHVDYLIMKCVQPALGNVKDPPTDSSRAIERLKIILNSLQNDSGDMTILSGIAKHLTSILKEKEQGPTTMMTNWLSAEASKPENINRAGTFRRFAVQCLESKVIPLLAGIIAFIDTNRNLDILTFNEQWKTDLWLQIFNDPELTQLRYTGIVSPSRQQELQEVIVKTTSLEGKVFSAVMPFSWLIFQQIDEVLRNTMNTKEVGDSWFDVVMKATEIFQELPLGRLLFSIEGTYIHQVLKSYILDFVHMVHTVQSEEECNLVCETVRIGCKILIEGEFGRLLPSLLGCHMTHILHDVRFKNFSHIVHVWAGVSWRTVEFQQKESNFHLVTDEEITLDILALHMLIDHLEPSKESLNKPETRTKWLRQVCDYRPIIERIFGHFNQDTDRREFHYGKKCQRGIEQARLQWTRVVVVKLFIEHVCTSGKEELDIRRCMPLWQTFREGADMKDIKSLEKMERFLKLCHKDIVKKCFGDQAKCISCENPIEGAPVRLPCDHVICRKCFYDCVTLKEFECPSCHEKFPEDLNPDKSENVGEIRKYQDYRTRCNSFFMEVVSQLCFAEGTPPSQEVIEKLLSYIIGHTKGKKIERVVSRELTIFDDSIDPTPVVRSFLLQQLMQTSGHEIETHLLAYFNYAERLVKTTGDKQQLIELCLLVMTCMEDSLHQQYANREDEITMATKMLRDAVPNITGEIELLDKIDNLSKVRFSLTVVSKYIHKLYGTAQKSMPDPTVRKLFDAASKICEECGSPWPRRYFVKQLCRCYGIESYQTVVTKSEASFLRWVRLPELKGNKVEECHDRYIVTGDEYKELRETIVTTVLGGNSEKLELLLQKPPNEWQTRIKLQLALHREMTMNNVYGGQTQKFTEKGKEFLNEFIMSHVIVKNKEITQGIIKNTLWRLPGNIIPAMELADQNISCLLTHFLVMMAEIPGKTTLLTPLHRITLEPQGMAQSYFPSMPQDEVSEIKEALLAARQQTPGENPVFYRCPNGHPYVIGNCGRAATVGICKACGREIGGEGYQLRAGNEVDTGLDRTETGHILGRATKMGPVSAPERKLNRASFSVLRLLTHISMYVGANVNLQAVCQSIKPNIEQADVGRYLIEHIDLDLTSVQNVLGKNKDEILVLIHYLLARIMNEHTIAIIGENQTPNVCGLLDKASRSKWEEEFAKRYIEPVIQDMQNILRVINGKILNDQRLGADPLLQILYETDKPQETEENLILHEVPSVWRYRAMITVNHLRQHLDAAQMKLPVLRLFLKEEHHLRAIRFVPSIIRLQKMLMQKYNRKLDRAEATTLTIADVKVQMRQERRLKEFGHLLEDYIEAWNCVRESLETYLCPANESLVTVDKEYCRKDITEDTSISHLIPTYKDAGLCSYALLFFLLKKQNIFLDNYCAQTKQKEDNLPKVHVKDISSAHLISYHPDKDLLPMVLANCNYSFEVGQGTRIDYNVTNLERQLMDRFLFSKSLITKIQEIETITYRSESTNAVVFKSLYLRVKQERLNPAVLSQICGELRLKSYPDLCESLDKLDIAISFLKSVGSDPESSLNDFMTNTLKMDNPFPSQKAQQATRCKHTMSLWITLAMERAKFLAKYDKKAFEGISENFKKPLTEDQTQGVEDILNKLPIELIDVFVELLFECIVLKIDVPQNIDDEDYVDMSKICLRDALIGYLDACPYDEDLTVEDTLMMAIGQLPSEKDNLNRISTAQSIEVWSLVNKVFTSKQRQRR
ncbi:E3 ubiquitin-protein ligase rnf213-alpha-like [Mytilus trossulus]|uniref:E3 ubiquitin-protein ligase rnf213-alpha-like n=1 Tax=Mytilus trossulus TaxID=6551 RepID=UPI0030073615